MDGVSSGQTCISNYGKVVYALRQVRHWLVEEWFHRGKKWIFQTLHFLSLMGENDLLEGCHVVDPYLIVSVTSPSDQALSVSLVPVIASGMVIGTIKI